MELLLVLLVAFLLLKPEDVLKLAQLLGHLVALKRKSQQNLQRLLNEAAQHTVVKTNTKHDRHI